MSSRTKALIASSLAGAIVAALMMAIAWQHNPQGRFHEDALEGGVLIHWGAWTLVGVSWFLPVAAGVLLAVGLCFGLRFLQHRARKQAAG
jgi:hypothetical protein